MRSKSRPNGSGTVYKSGKGWVACVTVGWIQPSDPSLPKRPVRRKKCGFPTKTAALNYCPILLAGGHEKPKEAPRLREYWETYSKGQMTKLSKSKQSAYKTAWNKLKPIHDVRIDAISVDLMQRVVADACPTFDPAKDCRSLLANLFEIAGAEQWVSKGLPSFITLPEYKEPERTPFTQEEQKRLWKAYEDGDKRAAIPLVMIYSGMMPAEAQALKVENIDLQSRTISGIGRKTKIRQQTPVVIADYLLPVLEDLIESAMPSGYLWPRNEKAWYENYYGALEKAGCRRLTPYSCRHTTATALAIDEKVAPQIIKKVMRWSTARMLDRYAHPDVSDALGAVNAIKKEAATAPEKNRG